MVTIWGGGLGFVVAGATALACRTAAAQGDGPPPAASHKPAVADGLAKAPAPREKERKPATSPLAYATTAIESCQTTR